MMTISSAIRWASLTSLCLAVATLAKHPHTPIGSSCTVANLQKALPKSSDATVLTATEVPQGGSYSQGAADIAYPTTPTNLPHLCAAIVNVTSTPTSSFRFGIFLPYETYNGRFLATGNGAFAGGINWLDMGAGSMYGFATISTDTGHNSTGIDGSWALNAPEVLNDWGYRAMHGSTVLAKDIVKQFYGKKASYNYYSGCSTGGRQGLRSVQLYPKDFDGVVAGSPAWWTSHLQPWTEQLGSYNLPIGAPNYIPPSQFPLIAAEALKQCDGIDGVKDNIITDPTRCKFKPETLLCQGTAANASTCLTAPQLQTLKNIYSDYVEGSTLIFPGLAIGSELQWLVLLSGIGGQPFPLGGDYIKYFLGDTSFTDYHQYNYGYVQQADKQQPGNATAYRYDMSAFKNAGGKLLMTHGWSDALISTGSTIYFHEQVEKAMLHKTKSKSLNDWYTLFMVPGMQHCAGTPVNMEAPWYFAGPNQAGAISTSTHSVPGFSDAKHDILLAMVDWVEKKQQPTQLIATRWANDTPSLGVQRQRPLCPYPQVAIYNRHGNVDKASSWKCGTNNIHG